jgi:hypothetical protein
VKVVFDNLADFLSISPNQTPVFAVCLPGPLAWSQLDISAVPVSCYPEVEFLEEIQTEVLRVFLLAIHRHLY